MAAEVEYGLRLPSLHPSHVEGLRRFVLRAEELGFGSIWVGDHVFHQVDVLQPLHLLTWVAAQTSRVRLGTAVMLSAYLNPVLLAKATSTIDFLSGGRLTLGMSIGGSEAEFKSIGIPMDQRLGRFLECISIVRMLWQDDDVYFKGKYFEIEAATVRPKPVQSDGIPILFGAFGDPMFRRAGKLGDGWIGGSRSVDVETFIKTVGAIRSYAVDAGREPDALTFVKLQPVSLYPDRRRALALAEKHWRSYYSADLDVESMVLMGDPEECRRYLSAFKDTPAPRVTVVFEPSTLELEQLHRLAEITVNA